MDFKAKFKYVSTISNPVLTNAAIISIYDLKQFKPKWSLLNQSVKQQYNSLIFYFGFYIGSQCFLFSYFGYISWQENRHLEMLFGWYAQEEKLSIWNIWSSVKQSSSWLLHNIMLKGSMQNVGCIMPCKYS